MIKKTPEGFEVTSEAGKPMSKPDLSKAEAEKRLQQIEMFKNMQAEHEKHFHSEHKTDHLKK